MKKFSFSLALILTGGLSTVSVLLVASGNAMLVQGLVQKPAVLKAMYGLAAWYIPLIWLPSLVVFGALLWYGRKHFPALTKLVFLSMIAGILATFALDVFRQLGVIHQWLPDTIKMFGKMIAGPKSSELSWTFWGLLYHYLNGISFAVLYVLLFRRFNLFTGLVWGLVIEFAMMTLPPMMPMFGFFGFNTGNPALFLITLVAHIAYGLMLGYMMKLYTRK